LGFEQKNVGGFILQIFLSDVGGTTEGLFGKIQGSSQNLKPAHMDKVRELII